MYDVIKKIFFKFEPEVAHKIAEYTMRSSFIFPGILSFTANKFCYEDNILKQNLLGMDFYNPIGIGGGFDKNGTMIKPLASLGFGYLEFGTFTPKSQIGNHKPRLFRLIEEESIQNAMGFNNEGSKKIYANISKIYPFALPIFANIGKNKITENKDAISDYIQCVKDFKTTCDAFVINVSSPNTTNLRDLQECDFIKTLFSELKNITNRPILFKISPDLEHKKAIEICSCAVDSGASGLIISNTTTDYSLSKNAKQFGGISGKLLTQKSKDIFKAISKELFGKTILISCGGIDSANEAYERIKLGANLIQIYTSFIFKGYGVVYDINKNLASLLKQDGFNHISEAIGIDIGK